MPNFAVGGLLLSATCAPYVDGSGNPVVDDDTKAIQVAFAAGTPRQSWTGWTTSRRMTRSRTTPSSCLFFGRCPDPVRDSDGEVRDPRFRPDVRPGRQAGAVWGRSRAGMGLPTWAVGDRAWLIYRRLLAPSTRLSSEALATAGDSATFRLVPATAYQTADVADVYNAGTNPNGRTIETTFTFLDPYAPAVTWTAIQQRPNATTAWANIASFAVDFDPSTEFRVVGALTDATGDLDRADFQAVAGNLAKTLFAGRSRAPTGEIEAVFTLPAGDWGFAMKVADLSGRQIEAALTPVGAGRL